MADNFQVPILDAINGGLVVLDREQRVANWNAWMVSASGYVADDVRGKQLIEIFPSVDLGRLTAAVAAALRSGVSSLITHALHPQLFPLTTRSGRRMVHDVTVSAIGGGANASCLIHISDVTMAVRRERYLRDRQNARYDAVVASAPDVILTLDGGGMIRFANPAAVGQFGYSEQELVGRHATTLFDGGAEWVEAWRSVLSDERPKWPVVLRAYRKDASVSYVEVSASRWQNDARVFVTAILRDINERMASEAALKASEEQSRETARALAQLNDTLEVRVQERTGQLLKAEEALRQSHKMEAIGQLTGGIAHDFNNFLQGIIGSLNIVQKRVAEGRISDIDRFVNGALSSADRASALTHRLLAFSRRQPIDPRPVDLNQLIAGMQELLQRSIGDRTRMNLEMADALWLVRCDVNQMENGLLNLAINARDAMPNGGTLTIATSNQTFDASQASTRDIRPGDHVCLEIRDDGVGMPPDVQARAFDPFYTTKPIGQGTGLGLSMIYGFVHQSQGSVRIESEVGSGTTIEICFPRFDGPLEKNPANDVETENSPTANNEVVLVVEDEDIVRLLVVEVLKDLGYHALEASGGPAALRILQSPQRIDLLITDIGLPEINGRQLADAARVKRPNLNVLFMTGFAERAASSEFLERGMEIIGKPFTMDEVAAKIRAMIEGQRNGAGA